MCLNKSNFFLHVKHLGLLAIDDIDDAGKWLENAKNEANKMLKHDQPHIIIAICHCGLTQVYFKLKEKI